MRVGFRLRRPVDLGPHSGIAFQETFLMHDLHQLQDRGVSDGLPGTQVIINLAHRRRPPFPDYSQNGKLGISRFPGLIPLQHTQGI